MIIFFKNTHVNDHIITLKFFSGFCWLSSCIRHILIKFYGWPFIHIFTIESVFSMKNQKSCFIALMLYGSIDVSVCLSYACMHAGLMYINEDQQMSTSEARNTGSNWIFSWLTCEYHRMHFAQIIQLFVLCMCEKTRF